MGLSPCYPSKKLGGGSMPMQPWCWRGWGRERRIPQGLLADLSTKLVNSSSIKRPWFEKTTRSHNREGNSMSNSLHENEHIEAHMHAHKCVCMYPDEKLQLSLTKKCKVSPNFLHCFKKVYTVRQ